MQTKQIITGAIAENTYLYYDEITKQGVIIDPGAEANKIIQTITHCGMVPQMILLTHGHYDHTGAVLALQSHYNISVAACQKEQELLKNPKQNASALFSNKPFAITIDKPLFDQDMLLFSPFALQVLHTPGHTSGCVCFYDKANNNLFSGDMLFLEEIGRTDLATGSYPQILDSLQNKLFALPNEVVVYPGHGNTTTIGHEKAHNPYRNEKAPQNSGEQA